MSDKTSFQYNGVIERCIDIFRRKNEDYGASWRILRIPSLIDQLYIKAKRIRTIEEKKVQKVSDDIPSEFVAMINYCAMTLLQMELGVLSPGVNVADDFGHLLKSFNERLMQARDLMLAKNHDYDEVWRDMWPTSYTDLILSKILRIRQILENDGKTQVSEGIASNLFDIINYSVFALIKIDEQNENQ